MGLFHAGLQSEVVNGPTSTASSYGPGQPPFRWSQNATINNTSHVGMPDEFAFVFERAGPEWTDDDHHHDDNE